MTQSDSTQPAGTQPASTPPPGTTPDVTQGEPPADVQESRLEEAQRRNPDLHGAALEALEGNEDGTGRTLG